MRVWGSEVDNSTRTWDLFFVEDVADGVRQTLVLRTPYNHRILAKLQSHLQFIVDACNAAEQRRSPVFYGERFHRFSVVKDGRVVRVVTVKPGEAVPLAQDEWLGPIAEEINAER